MGLTSETSGPCSWISVHIQEEGAAVCCTESGVVSERMRMQQGQNQIVVFDDAIIAKGLILDYRCSIKRRL